MCKFRNFEKYEVFEDGRIWSYKYKKFLKPSTDTSGYKIVKLFDNEGNVKTYKLHRVVYESVTGEPIPPNMQCNHINEDKSDNRFCNINLLTPKENSNWGTRNKRMANTLTNGKTSKQIGAFKNGEIIMSFKSISEAKRQGFSQGNICSCCRGERKTHKGYEWRYL